MAKRSTYTFESVTYTATRKDDDNGSYVTLARDGIWAAVAAWDGEHFEATIDWPTEVWEALEWQMVHPRPGYREHDHAAEWQECDSCQLRLGAGVTTEWDARYYGSDDPAVCPRCGGMMCLPVERTLLEDAEDEGEEPVDDVIERPGVYIASRTDLIIWIQHVRPDVADLGDRYVHAVADQVQHSDHPRWGDDWAAWLEAEIPGLVEATVDGLDALDSDTGATAYRLVVGERGNEHGQVLPCDATSDDEARAALPEALAPYRGEGWGRVEFRTSDMDGWERLDA